MPPEFENPYDEDNPLFDSWNIIYKFLQDASKKSISGETIEGVGDEWVPAPDIKGEDVNSLLDRVQEQAYVLGIDDSWLTRLSTFLFTDAGGVAGAALWLGTGERFLTSSFRDDIRKQVNDSIVRPIRARTDFDLAWEIMKEELEPHLSRTDMAVISQPESKARALDYWFEAAEATGEDISFLDYGFETLVPIALRTGEIPKRENIKAAEKLLVGLAAAGVDFDDLTPDQEATLSTFQRDLTQSIARAKATALVSGEEFNEDDHITQFAMDTIQGIFGEKEVDDTKALGTKGGRDDLIAGMLRNELFTQENGMLDSNGLMTELGKDVLGKVQAEFDTQWAGRGFDADGVRDDDWRKLLSTLLQSDIIPDQLAKDAAKVAQDAQKAADAESKRFAGLTPQQMVNEIATNMGLLTADTGPLMLNRLFGTSEASMSAMNQVENRVATAPAGTDYKELVKEIIENIDSPQMRPDAPPGVPGTAAANQKLYADYQKLLNDYNTSTLSEDVKGPRFQEALATLIRDNNLGVDIPTDGSPINQADVIMAITGQPMDIPGIISGREEDVGRSAEEVREGVAAAGPDMAATKANVDAIAQKYGINPDEYEEGTIPEMDAALAAFDEASKPLHQQWRRDEEERIRQEYDPSYDPGGQRLAGVPPQDEGYIPPDPGAESYGGEGQLTKEEWIEKYYPGKTEGVDLFIPEGQEETYTAPGDIDPMDEDIGAKAAHRVDEEVVPVRKMARFTTRRRGGARGF